MHNVYIWTILIYLTTNKQIVINTGSVYDKYCEIK